MNKKLFVGVGVIIILAVVYWLVSPLWRNVALNEELPPALEAVDIKDNLSTMDVDTKADFEKQTRETEGSVMKKSDSMPTAQPTTLNRVKMIARAHDVEGEAMFVSSGNETFLRFENLKTINGPDLRIYLGSALNADDVIDLGPIRATEGNVNYAIPAGTDLGKYKNVMIWCRAFGVLFSYAQL